MRWDEAMAGVPVRAAKLPAIEIAGVQYDSRRVCAGDIFVAMRGGGTDGNRFIAAALQRGAAAVVTDSYESYGALRRDRPKLGVALVERGRRGLAGVSANVFGHPEAKLAVSAVTGTNGKTTTAFLLEQMLRSVGRTTVLMGTIETHVGEEVRASAHTTPESRDLLELFADGVRVGATEVVMEMSSHALEQERVWGVPVDVAMFTNLTQDHLDYHGTMEDYFAAKARLFRGVGSAPPRVAVVNADDAFGARLVSGCYGSSMLVTFGIEGGDYRAETICLDAGETRFRMATPLGGVQMTSPLSGRVNVYNLLGASAAAVARGLSLEQVVIAAKSVRQVPGRFETVPNRLGITVVVDYAHTDDALRNLIALARELVSSRGGRVITLFGCGGDRDRSKRPKMGRAAAEGSDLVILTSDNPRSEEPMAILQEALAGVREKETPYLLEEDRAGAISIAIRAASRGDIVLLAGKGHEKQQILQDRTVPFDDVEVASGVLREME